MKTIRLKQAAFAAAVAGATALGIAGSAAFAQEATPGGHPAPHAGPHGGKMLMERADQNDDGVISYDEAVASLPGMTEDRFKHMDFNADGVLNSDEMRPSGGRGERGVVDPAEFRQRFKNADADGDGKLNATEVEAFSPRGLPGGFEAYDSNKDGGVTLEEMIQARPQARGEGGGHAGPRYDPMTHMDADGNGEISLEEFRKVRPDTSESRFAELDTDKSGGVTREEMMARMAQRGERASSPEQRAAFMEEMFARRDTNQDGGMSFEEYQAARPQMTQDRFDAMDTDGDGIVSKEEFSNGFGRRVAQPESSGEHRHPVDAPKN